MPTYASQVPTNDQVTFSAFDVPFVVVDKHYVALKYR
jgi:hypothetical protein